MANEKMDFVEEVEDWLIFSGEKSMIMLRKGGWLEIRRMPIWALEKMNLFALGSDFLDRFSPSSDPGKYLNVLFKGAGLDMEFLKNPDYKPGTMTPMCILKKNGEVVSSKGYRHGE